MRSRDLKRPESIIEYGVPRIVISVMEEGAGKMNPCSSSRGLFAAQPGGPINTLLQLPDPNSYYRFHREPWKGSADPPNFLRELGLSLPSAEQFLATVQQMSTELARQLGERDPWWLTAEAPSYFEIQTERKK